MTANFEHARSLRDQGIAALRAGRLGEAQELLAQSVELNPDDEHAWLWLSATAESDEDKRFCLEKVLALNPASEVAKKGLAKLPKPAPAPAPAPLPPAAMPPAHAGMPQLPPLALPATTQTIPLAPAPTYEPSPSSYYVPSDNRTYRRPGCVTCLASCSFITGVFCLIAIALFAAAIQQVAKTFDFSDAPVNIPSAFLGAIGLIFGVVALIYFVQGFGLWTGKRFAWWLTIFYFAWTIMTELFGVVDLIIHRKELEALVRFSRGPDFGAVFAGSLILSLVVVAFSALVITMLFIPDTLGFFKLSYVKKQKALAIVFGLSLVLSLCFRPSSSVFSRAMLGARSSTLPGNEQPFEFEP